ncbi:MAG TPA: right-handed parallel beta-helix repeat-containing protein [Acidimicrobiales bacterium]|nr:right-handed parallel beta-helix repeat-containing protein [Acidimicrobiales bacterium]
MRRNAGRIATVGALLLASGLGLVAPAHAAVLSCGQTITQSTVLENDVGPCTNNGIVIGADNITFDLNGHRIFGRPGSGDRAGVYLRNRRGVTVRNGTVSGFDIGVAVEGGSGNTVTGMVARDNIGGVGGTGGDGIAILSSRGNRVLNNRTHNNGPFSGIGLYSRVDQDHPRQTAGVSRDNLIDGNSVTNNVISRNQVSPVNTDNDGIRVENDAAFNTFTNNQVHGNGLDGISLFADTSDNVVRNNVVTRNGFFRTTARRGSGIIVFTRSTRNVVEYNRASENADSGIDIRPPLQNFPGATNNRIRFNVAVNNSQLPFIPSPVFGESFDLKDANPNCDANVWFGNRYRTFNQPCVTTGGQQI